MVFTDGRVHFRTLSVRTNDVPHGGYGRSDRRGLFDHHPVCLVIGGVTATGEPASRRPISYCRSALQLRGRGS